MPVPSPQPNQSETEFMAQCITFLTDEGTPMDEAAAICYSKWEEHEDEVESESED